MHLALRALCGMRRPPSPQSAGERAVGTGSTSAAAGRAAPAGSAAASAKRLAHTCPF
eukprot:CAMPEP_0170210046 /NCGR_PEP_ID=MMETSP0116_2-20130129/4618_1 /TAXON_ID=400756 /ORGANISM="Durinskia baltica, Strain CSIRO CS-38" /LENGTH=56 /DNA_ID=CAMNT_0010460539 /DNA_START=285 /DNA_END=452 /DNA_ORIENTATION=+